MLQVFPSRGVIRVTMMRYKMNVFLQILQTELESIRREKIYIGDLVSQISDGIRVPKGKGFQKWIERNLNDSILQELSRLTNTTIVRTSHTTVGASLERFAAY